MCRQAVTILAWLACAVAARCHVGVDSMTGLMIALQRAPSAGGAGAGGAAGHQGGIPGCPTQAPSSCCRRARRNACAGEGGRPAGRELSWRTGTLDSGVPSPPLVCARSACRTSCCARRCRWRAWCWPHTRCCCPGCGTSGKCSRWALLTGSTARAVTPGWYFTLCLRHLRAAPACSPLPEDPRRPSASLPPPRQIIAEHMGGRTSALLRFLLAATRFLHRDGYAALTARLRGLHADLGQGFAAQLALGESQSSLTISRCLYHDIFAEEGQPQLATACCCTQDQVRQAAACPAAARPHCSLHAEGAACPHAAHAPQISATQATHEATAVPGAPPPPPRPRPQPNTRTQSHSHTPTTANSAAAHSPAHARSGLSRGTEGWRPAGPRPSAPGTPAAASACGGCRRGRAWAAMCLPPRNPDLR